MQCFQAGYASLLRIEVDLHMLRDSLESFADNLPQVCTTSEAIKSRHRGTRGPR